MIPRYATEEMVLIWSEENKYKLWAEIEILAWAGYKKAR